MAAPMRMLSRAASLLVKRSSDFRTCGVRAFSCSTSMFASDADFEAAQGRVQTLKSRPDNDVMLKLYSLFKQASVGECNTKKPGALDFVGKAKWTAWKDLGNMSNDSAKDTYINLVNQLVAAEGGSAEPAPSEAAATDGDAAFKFIKVAKENATYSITLNRPEKKNALNRETYREIEAALKAASEDSSVAIATITGAGDFYCSGNDLSNFTSIDPSNVAQGAKEGRDLLLDFVAAFINFDKPLIGVVNGPAIGVAATTLGLCDVVYASDKATFQTPMVALGQSPEGCATTIFPKIMGLSRANEMLLFGRQITAKTAYDWGFVTEVFPHDSFRNEVNARIAKLAQLPPESLRYSKQLMRNVDKDALHAANKAECDRLEERWQSNECFTAIMNFFEKKSKL